MLQILRQLVDNVIVNTDEDDVLLLLLQMLHRPSLFTIWGQKKWWCN